MSLSSASSHTCPVEHAAIPALLEFVEDRTRAAGGGRRTALKLRLVAEEIATNIVKGARPEAPGIMELVFRTPEAGVVELEFRDQGPAFDPLARPAPDLELGLEEREPGGLGIFLAREYTDHMAYRRDGESNVLTLSKSFTPEAPR